MNEARIDSLLLKENIEKINFYADREKDLLENISSHLIGISGSYSSSNTQLITEKAYCLKNSVNTIYEKRLEYTHVLNRAISNYVALAKKTVETFEKEV